ncbi:MAG: YciI family protein [Labedaea sp.]
MFAVRTAKGPNWDPTREIRTQRGWEQHARFTDRLVDAGTIVLGGPISTGDNEDIALLMVHAATEADVRATFDDDPWTTLGVFRIKAIWPWTIWLDASRVQTGT